MSEKAKTTDKDWQQIQDNDIETSTDEPIDPKEAEQVALASDEALEHPDYEALEAKLTEAEQLAHEMKENHLRAQAELDNVRKRMERELANAHKFAVEKFVTALLPVIDSLERGLEVGEKSDDASLKEGLALTLKMFQDTLAKFSIEPLSPLGEVFDPALHEAVSMQPSEEHKPGTVMTVIQKGYLLNGRVIRPAMVVVVKAE